LNPYELANSFGDDPHIFVFYRLRNLILKNDAKPLNDKKLHEQLIALSLQEKGFFIIVL